MSKRYTFLLCVLAVVACALACDLVDLAPDGIPHAATIDTALEYMYFKVPLADADNRPLRVYATAVNGDDPDSRFPILFFLFCCVFLEHTHLISVSLFISKYITCFHTSCLLDHSLLSHPFHCPPTLIVYVSVNADNECPNSDNNDGSAVSFGGDSITVKKDQYLDKDFAYISVFAWSNNAVFRVVATFSEIDLNDGIPQSGHVFIGEMETFEFKLPNSLEGHKDITIAATPVSGFAQIDVTWGEAFPNGTNPGKYGVTEHNGGEIISIPLNATEYGDLTPGATIKIGVYAPEVTCDFFLVAALDQTNIHLSSGIQQFERASVGEYEYFQVNVTRAHCNLTISVTPITGDPDLYVSRTVDHPSMGDHEEGSYNTNENETIIIVDAAVGPYYISVEAFPGRGDSDFIILPTTECGDHPEAPIISNGVPHEGFLLNKNDWAFYQFRTSNHDDLELTVSLATVSGDPDIYITRSNRDEHGGNPANWNWPTTDNYLWRAISYGEDFLHIDPVDSLTGNTWYLIGVRAFTAPTDFTVTITTNKGEVLLREGVFTQAQGRAGEPEYFKIPVRKSGEPLEITVSDVGIGSAMIYVSPTCSRLDPDNRDGCEPVESGEGAVRIDDTEVGTYHITVIPASDSQFSITAVVNAPIELLPSISTWGDLEEAGDEDFYLYTVRGEDHEVYISSLLFNGKVDIYVSNDRNVRPNPDDETTYQWYSPWDGNSHSIDILDGDVDKCDASTNGGYCTYYILVKAFTPASYSILARSFDSAPVRLVQGEGVIATVPAGQYKEFMFISEHPEYYVSIAVTPQTGDPDLFVSFPNATAPVDASGRHPNTNIHPGPDCEGACAELQRSSTSYGGDIVNIDDAIKGIYYVGVHAYNAESAFTVVAQARPLNITDRDQVIVLSNHRDQIGFVPRHHYDYYQMSVTDIYQNLTFSVSSYFGDPDIVVAVQRFGPGNVAVDDFFFPTVGRGNNNYSSSNLFDDTVFIPNPSPGIYTIGVYGFHSSSFLISGSLTGSANDTNRELQSHLPTEAYIMENHNHYYRFLWDDLTKEVSISLTYLSGLFGELYVSNTSKPDAQDYRIKNGDLFEENILIEPSSPHFQQCRDNPTRKCYVYITVNAWQDLRYSIIANLDAPISVEDGQPQRAYAREGQMRLFALRVSDHEDLTIVVTPRYGSPIIFLNPASNENTHGDSYPHYGEPETYKWSTEEQWVGETLYIDHKTEGFCQDEVCQYWIGVYGVTDVDFQITASTNFAAYTLIQGEPLRISVSQRAYEYFVFNLEEAVEDLYISVTANSGDPDIYVSNDPAHYKPNRENTDSYRWESSGYGSDVIHIETAHRGQYYIGVYAFDTSDFIVEFHQRTEYATLSNGQPQYSESPADHCQYFKFKVQGHHKDAEISVNRLAGNPALYIKQSNGVDNGKGPDRPDSENFDWSAAASGESLIRIGADKLTPGWYYMCAIDKDSKAYFTVTFASDDHITSLQDGVPLTQDLNGGETEYFVINVDENAPKDSSLDVTVTSFIGDPDLYVSNTVQKPTSSTPNTRVAMRYLEDTITIPADELETGRWYIGVYGWTDVSFTITATFRNTTQLTDGLPQSSSVLVEEMNYYRFTISPDTTDFEVTLTPLTGSAYLYVSEGSTYPVYGHPSTYNYSSTSWHSSQNIRIQGIEHNVNNELRTYTVGIYGQSAITEGSRHACNYSLLATTFLGTTILQTGVPQLATLNSGKYTYFVFKARGEPDDIVISVTDLGGGDPDIYLSIDPTNPRPTLFDNDDYAARNGSDVMIIEKGSPAYNDKDGQYFIGVFGWTDTTFTIVADAAFDTVNQTVHLVDGIPQISVIQEVGEFEHFVFSPSSVGHNDLRFTLSTSTDSDVEMYIRNDIVLNNEGKPVRFPGPGYAQWETNIEDKELIIDQEMDGFDPNADYYVTVTASAAPSIFRILAGVTNGIQWISIGESTQERLSEGKYSYFHTGWSQEGKPLTFTLTALSGDPDLFINFYPDGETPDDENKERPTKESHMFSRTAYLSDSYTFDSAESGNYYIGVYASGSDCEFNIVADWGVTALSDGDVVTGAVYEQRHRTYRFYVSDPKTIETVTISLTPTSGDVVMYITNDGTQPTPDNFAWSTFTTDSHLRNTITISPQDARCAARDIDEALECTFFVAVHNRPAVDGQVAISESHYTIGYNTGIVSTLLVNGLPLNSRVIRDTFNYYRYVIREHKAFSISLTTFDGDADLFVSASHRFPNYRNSTWRSQQIFLNNDHVTVDPTDDEFVLGTYYIGVQGFQTSTYTISVSSTLTRLSTGTSTLSTSSPSGSFFDFRFNPENKNSIYISCEGLDPVDANLEFKVFTSNVALFPGTSNHTDFATVFADRPMVIRPTSDSLRDGHMYVGVYLSKKYDKDAHPFKITVNSGEGLSTLNINSVASTVLEKKESQFFQLPLNQGSRGNYTVELEVCHGHAQMFLTEKNNFPSATNNEGSTKDVPDDEISKSSDTLSSSVIIQVKNLVKDEETGVRIHSFLNSTAATRPYISDRKVFTYTKDTSNVHVTWKTADFKLSDGNYTGLHYRVYYAKSDSSAVMETPCGMQYTYNNQPVALSCDGCTIRDPMDGSACKDGECEVVIKGLSKHTRYVVNVVVTPYFVRGAEILYNDLSRAYSVQTVQLEGSASEKSNAGTILGITIPLLLLVIAAAVYLYMRNRKLSKVLEVEMHDVPMSAVMKAVRGPRSADTRGDAKKYMTLLEEEEDEEEGVGHEYIPPI